MTKTDLQARIQQLLDHLVAEGVERGVQVAVYQNGELVVDAWAGAMDVNGAPVDGDTLFPVFSVTKGFAATLVHILAERGVVDYDAPIAVVWPEFAAAGKGGITLRQALNHSAGLQNIPSGLKAEDLADWDRMCAVLAAEAPAFEPGTMASYHAITYSWLVGEVLRRADGRDFPTLLREEIASPLGLEHLYCGMPESVDKPVAVLDEPGVEAPEDDGKPAAIPAWVQPLYVFMNRRDAQRACMPATSGVITARAIALHYAALLPGGVDGVELLPPERVRLATEPQGLLRGNGEPAFWGLGYQRHEHLTRPGGEQVAFGHNGYGGSSGWADPSRGLAVGITKNLLGQHDTIATVQALLVEGN